jgi:hypothetical protein
MRLPSASADPPLAAYWSTVPSRATCLPVWQISRTQQSSPRTMRREARISACSLSFVSR